jgi:hypothetical protein
MPKGYVQTLEVYIAYASHMHWVESRAWSGADVSQLLRELRFSWG